MCSFHYSLTSYPIKKVTGLIFKYFVICSSIELRHNRIRRLRDEFTVKFIL